MGFLSVILFLLGIYAGIQSGSFVVFLAVAFGGSFLVGLAMGKFQTSVREKQQNRQNAVMETRERLQRGHIDAEDAVVAIKVLEKLRLLSGDALNYAEWELNNSTFSSVPMKRRRLADRVEKATIEDAEDALNFLARNRFILFGAAQDIQNEIDARVEPLTHAG